MAKKWIKKALRYHKKGALHRQLGVSIEENISINTLNRIKNAKIGDYIYNDQHYYKSGSAYIKVTPLLKKRVVLALNLRRLK